MRHARRTDANHARIRQRFRELGWTVEDLSHIGHGVPDLYVERMAPGEVGLYARCFFVEVKDGEKPPSARRLTDDEGWFHAILKRAGVRVQVIEHVDQVANL